MPQAKLVTYRPQEFEAGTELSAHSREDLREAVREDDDAADGGSSVGDCLGGIDTHDAQEGRQDQGERNEQEDLAQQRDKERNPRLVQCNEQGLAGALHAEDGHARKKDRHDTGDQGNKLHVLREQPCK